MRASASLSFRLPLGERDSRRINDVFRMICPFESQRVALARFRKSPHPTNHHPHPHHLRSVAISRRLALEINKWKSAGKNLGVSMDQGTVRKCTCTCNRFLETEKIDGRPTEMRIMRIGPVATKDAVSTPSSSPLLSSPQHSVRSTCQKMKHGRAIFFSPFCAKQHNHTFSFLITGKFSLALRVSEWFFFSFTSFWIGVGITPGAGVLVLDKGDKPFSKGRDHSGQIEDKRGEM